MLKFYECDVIEIINEDSTLTQTQNIFVENESLVEISLHVPLFAAGVRVYRSTEPDQEKLLLDIPFSDSFRNRPQASSYLVIRDTGNLTPSLDSFPVSTTLTSEEQRAIPIPEFSLSTMPGGTLISDTYHYRLSFYTKKDIAYVYTNKNVSVKYFKPDLSKAMVYTRDDISSETSYTEILNPFEYIGSISGEIIHSDVFMNGESYVSQKLLYEGNFINKIVAPVIPVSIKTEANTVLVSKPVLFSLSPSDIEIQVLENSLKGTPQTMLGTVVKVFTEEGSLSYFPSDAAKFLFSISGGSVQVLA